MIDEIVRIGQDKNIVGIYTPPVSDEKKVLIIFINAGFIHRVGPQRYYVKLARTLSQNGYGCVRIDLPGKGDSQMFEFSMDGETQNYFAITRTINYFFEKKGYARFCLLGFCSGAKIAFVVATNDSRVKGVVCINDIFFEDPRVFESIYPVAFNRQKTRYYKKSIFKISSWRKLLTGKGNLIKKFYPHKLLKRSVVRDKSTNTSLNKEKTAQILKINVSPWENIIRRGGCLLHVFSEGSLSLDFYEILFKSKFAKSIICQDISLHTLKSIDHNFTTIESQKILTKLICEWFEGKLEPLLRKDELDFWRNPNETDNERVSLINQILIIIEYNHFYIGNNCKLLSQLSLLKKYYYNAKIDINSNNTLLNEMVYNNPYIHSVNNKKIEEIDLNKYQVVYVCSFYEQNICKYLYQQKSERRGNKFAGKIYSISSFIDPFVNQKFPLNKSLINFLNITQNEISSGLYVSAEEVNAANKWLEENKVAPGEKILVYLKGSTNTSKLINNEVEDQLLTRVLSNSNWKILIYDDDKGTCQFDFRRKRKDEEFERFIFAPKMNLRRAITILSSNYVQMVFGPTTGFIHCASEIYKNFFSSGKRVSCPKILAYFGNNEFINYNEWLWWKDSLATVLYPKMNDSQPKLEVLSEESYSRDLSNNSILTSNYITYQMLDDYLTSNEIFIIDG